MKNFINNRGYEVPQNTIVVVPFNKEDKTYLDIVLPLKNQRKREWFTPHFYYCLPIVVGNQYGFAIRSLIDFDAIWSGEEDPESTTINILNDDNKEKQYVISQFGSGIVTIQNTFHFKTPPNINLMVIQPPNFFIAGCSSMTGVVEADNIRRDFTFNLKITVPNFKISVRKGDIIGAFIPIPRGFVDNFEIKPVYDIFSNDLYMNEIEEGSKLAEERITVDLEKPHLSGRRYFSGIHTDETLYFNHQKKLN